MKKKLPNIWEDGEYEEIEPQGSVCKHSRIIRVSGTEIKCQSCSSGWMVGQETEIKDGKWLIDGERVFS